LIYVKGIKIVEEWCVGDENDWFEWIWEWSLCYFFKGFGTDEIDLKVNLMKDCEGLTYMSNKK